MTDPNFASGTVWTGDNMLPRSRGGTDHPDNLQLLCSGCNRSKGDKTMAEWRAAT